MTKKTTTAKARSGPETLFQAAAPAAPFRALQQDRFERLRAKLVEEKLEALFVASEAGLIQRAANEAAALAWVSPFPLLVFPALFEENYERALLRQERQDQVWQRSRELLAV
jgi:hypothetical protein